MAVGTDAISWYSNPDTWKGLGAFAGGLGSITGGIMNYQLGKDALDWQKKTYNTQYNDYITNREKNKQAVANAFGTPQLGTYSVPTI